MNIAFVGTGFVADYYMTTLKNFPKLRLCGVFDRSPARLNEFSRLPSRAGLRKR